MNYDDVIKFFEYDKERGVLVWVVNRKRAKAGMVFGVDNGRGYLQGQLFGKRIYSHRLIWLFHNKEMPDGEIDHIDGDSKNNRIENLRVVSRYENSTNMHKVRSDSKTQIQGVQKRRRKWAARITVNGVKVSLGSYSSAEVAGEAYMRAKIRFHHSYAGGA